MLPFYADFTGRIGNEPLLRRDVAFVSLSESDLAKDINYDTFWNKNIINH